MAYFDARSELIIRPAKKYLRSQVMLRRMAIAARDQIIQAIVNAVETDKIGKKRIEWSKNAIELKRDHDCARTVQHETETAFVLHASDLALIATPVEMD